MHLEDIWELNQWCSGRDTRSDEDREVERLQRRWRRMFRFRTPTADERMAVEIELCYAQRARELAKEVSIEARTTALVA